MLLRALLTAALVTAPASAQEPDRAYDIMQAVNARADGEQVQRSFTLTLTDRNGSSRVQEITGYRRYFGEEKRTILFYTDPTSVRGTGFLTFDYPDPNVDDDQWLYLPALRRVRRIPASDRGDAFLGTDFSYEEIKKESKVEISDYDLSRIGEEQVDGHSVTVIEGVPVDAETADALGHSRVRWHIDNTVHISRRTQYWDSAGNPSRTVNVVSIEEIDGIWTPMEIVAENLKTGHSTRLAYSEVDYSVDAPESLFSQARLRRGP